jgi:deoxyadenosine/deoxycytidine kinase
MPVIVIDAEIGAGKSTLLKVLSERLEVPGREICIITEPVELWKEIGALDDFYSDVKRNAYKFQTFTFVTRVNKCLEEFKDKNTLYIIERSIYSDKDIFVEMLYKEGNFTELEYKMYLEWWHMWKKIMPFEPSAFVYLKTPLELCLKRIQERARGKEVSVDIKYHKDLKKQHVDFMNKRREEGFQTFELDGTIDYKNDENGKEKIVEQMKEIIKDIFN